MAVVIHPLEGLQQAGGEHALYQIFGLRAVDAAVTARLSVNLNEVLQRSETSRVEIAMNMDKLPRFYQGERGQVSPTTNAPSFPELQ